MSSTTGMLPVTALLVLAPALAAAVSPAIVPTLPSDASRRSVSATRLDRDRGGRHDTPEERCRRHPGLRHRRLRRWNLSQIEPKGPTR